MNWEAIGAIGEIIGALAVFSTLAYLAIQIRQNTVATRISALDSTVGAVASIREQIIANEDVAQIFINGSKDPSSLSEVQITRYRVLMTNIVWSAWNFYSQYTNGGLSREFWEVQKTSLKRIVGTPGGLWYWDQFRNEFEDAFAQEVDKIIGHKNDDNDT